MFSLINRIGGEMKANLKQLSGRIKNSLILLLIAVLGLMLAGRATAQTFTTLYNFTALVDYNNSDGAVPEAGVILSGNTLYGTAYYGGSSGNGTVFALNTNGTGFTNLYSFTGGSDGASPQAVLILSGNTLYGTASSGGSSGNGTVFAVNTNSTDFTNLYSFTAYPSGYITNSDGAYPYGGLILSGNTLYGTAEGGGSSGNGTVFRVNTNGMDFTNLYSFTATTGSEGYFGRGTNSDGANPIDSLILSGTTLYGTTQEGGSGGNGTVFAVNTDGTGFTNLHSFAAYPPGYYTNSDGVVPAAGLILSGNTLYGTAEFGGSLGNGTVFALNTNGTGFTNLHNFTGGSDGDDPAAGLLLSGNTLYGTAQFGGSLGWGTVFAVNTNGTDFTTLYSFTAISGTNGIFGFGTNSDGAGPQAVLILSGNTLYGTAAYGGSSGNGTVFSLFIPPQLTIVRSGTNVMLTWPTNYAGFTLEFATNLVSPTVWKTNSTAPVVVNGQNTMTNPISGTQTFFRLVYP
jgi:uncharacterized repeat protein (TIGR03803 family)